MNNCYTLPAAPATIEHYGEIATQYNDQLPGLWNTLTPAERIFAYFLTRACLPGNRIYADQVHRDSLAIIELFEHLVTHKDRIQVSYFSNDDHLQFTTQVEQFFVYLSAHHGPYFLKEFEDHKRTPERLNLFLLTPEHLITALESSGFSHAQEKITAVYDTIFVTGFEPTLTVAGSIEKSGGNFYSADFTEEDFMSLPLEERSSLNNYLYIDSTKGRVATSAKYKIGGKYSHELSVSHYWLMRAKNHARQHPEFFDHNIPTCLEDLIRYLETGNEEDFRRFSIAWLKTNSRIDFNFGFVEVYQDPKKYRGSFEADVTIKVIDMATLNTLLPSLEAELPFPSHFMRSNLHDTTALPNASVNAKLCGSGDAGPVKITAAYCLPNYSDIRSQYGSKQIIYQQGKGLTQLIDPDLALRLFMCKKHVEWLSSHDPQGTLNNDLWDILTLLHETLGHGSGKLATHTFVEGDPLCIDGTTYSVGQTIELTKSMSNEFIGHYSDGLEELRAEIIALYTSIYNFDQLAAAGVYKDWPQKIGKEKLIEWFITHMAQQGIRRLLSQKDDAKEIVQAHAQANTAILNYLLDHGGLELVQEPIDVKGVPHIVTDVVITNAQEALQAIKDLTIEVQRIKSTADGRALEQLMQHYGSCVRKPELIKELKKNRHTIQGDLKEVAEIFPGLTPVNSINGQIIDVTAQWPNSFVEQQLYYSRIALSKD